VPKAPWLFDLPHTKPPRVSRDVPRDLLGLAVLVGLVIVPIALGAAWKPLGPIGELAVFLGLPVALWARGPAVGIDRRAAVLVCIPFIGLFAVVPAVWRWAHKVTVPPSTTLEPPWGRVGWTISSIIGVACSAGVVAAAISAL